MDGRFKNFVSPHVHIQSLDSASTPEAFLKREVELGTGALVVTDHGTLAACQPVYELARKGLKVKNLDGSKTEHKLTPILGLEGYFRDDNCPVFGAANVPRNDKGTYGDYFKYAHFTTHFLDQAAFQVGIRLLSKAPIEKHGQESKPLFNWANMEELGAANTTITTGCLIGMVQRHLLQNNDPEMAKKYYARLRAMVRPGNFFVEVFPHVCSHNWVQGVFFTLQEEGGEPFKLRFYAGKTLRTNVGEIKAGELAKAFARRDNEHTHLVAVKDYRAWNERNPARLLTVEHIEDFLPNECRPWCPDGDVQLGANKFMIELANSHGDPILVSDDAHYAHPDEKIVQDVRLAQSGSWRFYGSYHRQSSEEAFQYFRDRIGTSEREFEGWVENSHGWAGRFRDFKLVSKPDIPTKFYEELYAAAGCKNSLEYTLHLIKQHGRMDWKDPERVARLKREIALLYRNGVIDLLPYFFIDEEVCRLYRDKKMLTGPGRGSAAGCSLAYYLGITHVDPIKYGLSFERFLTEDRVKSGKLPDIDQDLPTREPLVGPDGNSGWLQERFGDHVAQISTVMTLKLKSAVLDVARFTYKEVPKDIAALAHKFELPPQGLEDYKFAFGYEDSGNWVPGSMTWDPPLMEYIEKYPDQWKIVQKCLGLGRGVSRHACAYVIANRPIWEFIPLTKISDVTCTQFTAGAVEAMGGLKMDFLVINSLNDIANAILMVQQRSGMTIPEDGLVVDGKWVPAIRLVPYQGRLVDIWDLPPAQEVFADVATGKTETVFQFNTPGAVQWLRHFGYKKPNGNYAIDSVDGMSAFTALDRPGPLDAKVRKPGVEVAIEAKSTTSVLNTLGADNTGVSVVSPKSGGRQSDGEGCHNMLVEYARRARGAEPSPDIFVIFDQLFPETHGIMVYQEQLQRLYQEVTGCTLSEAEAFRGDVAKKKKEKIIAAYPKFIEGATEKLGSKEDAEAIWQFINTWAAYGFNRSHAICYSVIGYACAFLKHYYPLEWWTAVLQNAKKEEINEKFWRHCGKHIDLPDVTKAHPTFTIVGERIQAPLSLLHGVGETASKELLEGAPYASIQDFVAKVEAKKLAGTTTKTVKQKKKGELGQNGEPVEEEVEKIVKGRSALNSGIAYKLIVSGAMDKLFPATSDTLDMLEAYEKAVFDHAQAAKAAAGKKPSKRAAPKPVKAEFLNLTQYTRYQLRKSILPAYSEDVAALLVERQHPRVFHDGRMTRYRWVRNVGFASADQIERINHASRLPENGVRVAVAGYVEDVRVFQYGPKDEAGRRLNPRMACDLTVDVNGARHKFVRWPDRETGELSTDGVEGIGYGGLKGALVILVLSTFREGKALTIDAIEVVQAPLGSNEETTPEESK